MTCSLEADRRSGGGGRRIRNGIIVAPGAEMIAAPRQQQGDLQ